MVYSLTIDRPFPESVQKEIEILVARVDSLLKVVTERATEPPDFSPNRTFAAIAERLDLSYSDVGGLFSTLENLIDMREAGAAKSAEITSGVLARLSPPRAEKLKPKMVEFVRLLDTYTPDHPIHISIKARKLSYLREHLYQDGEVITDVRPIFDAAGGAVREMVISHSLVVSSFSYGEGGRRTHFALDAADLLRLKDACERAIRKAGTLKEALGGKQWAVKILNETEDAH